MECTEMNKALSSGTSELALVTGATGGFGKAMAVECARRGWDLLLTDLDQRMLQLLSTGLSRSFGISSHFLACDLTRTKERQRLYDWLHSLHARPTLLANVAGLDREGAFIDRDGGEIRTILRLNVEAALENTLFLLQISDGTRRLKIINVSSLAAYYAMPYKAMYAASKGFLLSISLALKEELRQRASITVLCPAGMPTTPLSVEAIEAQGLMGRLTSRNTNDVARQTIDGAIAGKTVVIPGMLNRMLLHLSALVPTSRKAALIGMRWAAAIAKRTEHA